MNSTYVRRDCIEPWTRVLALAARCSLILVVASALAWGQAISGDVFGTLTDNTGAVVAGASVTATNVATGFVSSATTNANGEFRFSNLPVGSYNLAATGNGLRAALANFTVELNKTATAKLVMQPESATTTVEVSTR